MITGEPALNDLIEVSCADGIRKTLRNSAVPVRADDGTVQGAILLNEDITDRVRAEQALRQEHALLMAVMDAAPDIIFVKDLDGRYIHINRAGASTLGMPVEDVIGWNDYALWPADLAASCQLADRRVPGEDHLGEHRPSERMVGLGVEAVGDGVHGVAPRPEVPAVVVGAPAQRAVEDVAVAVGEPGEDDPPEPDVALRGRGVRADVTDPVVVDHDSH